MRNPFQRNTWTLFLDGVSFTLPADLPEVAVTRPVRSQSTFDALREAVRMYLRHFLTIAAIFLIPMGLGEILVRLLHEQLLAGFVIRWVTTVMAFGPLVYAISDVCAGNRPRIRRNYRRAGWRTLLVVSLDCAVATAFIAVPVIAAYLIIAGLISLAEKMPTWVVFASYLGGFLTIGAAIVMMMLILIWVLYVPIIAVLEPRISPFQAIKRSRSLGQGHSKRTAAVAAVIVVIFMLAGWIYTQFAASPFELVGILAARLLGPIPYIAATLIYYDLRARKEGYGITERPEDLH